jgi:septum formation protein
LRNAGLDIVVHPVRVDEATIRESLLADGANSRDIADALAEHKALKGSTRALEALVLGCDQILDCDGRLYAKPMDPADAVAQLRSLRGKTHRLFTAAVLYDRGQPVWRHVNVPRLTMRPLSDALIDDYVSRNWDDIRHCVGCYQIEGPGVRLFEHIEGDLFSIQGLPLLELLTILIQRKDIQG